MIKNLIVGVALLSLVASFPVEAAQPRQVYIDVVVKSVRSTAEGGQTDMLSAPAITTQSGAEASMQVVSTFSTSVPGHEDLTEQNGNRGIIVTATPYLVDASILLKGHVRVLIAPVKRVQDSGAGETAVQESLRVQFSLKLDGSGRPVEVGPMSLSGGRQLFLMVTAYEVTPDGKKVVKKN
jgi:hypothetical protein